MRYQLTTIGRIEQQDSSAAHHLAAAGFAVAMPSENAAFPGPDQPVANHPELNDETVR